MWISLARQQPSQSAFKHKTEFLPPTVMLLAELPLTSIVEQVKRGFPFRDFKRYWIMIS